MFKIAKIKIKNNLCLAPMAGISNEAFRILCTKCGAGFVYSEMISDIAIIKKNKKTLEILKHCKNEKNIIIQLFGSDSDTLSQAAKIIEKTCKPIAIDINMGCPVSKVCIKKKAGSALLKNPQKIKEIVTAVVCSVKIPVTVKIRAGWDKNNINCVEIAKIIEKCGAKLIAIHPRTRAEMFEGKSN
ncbi:hypothetical protein FACS189496_5450 [Bacilli bacterium]|nr:hypothetical protein FACS189496_5450 [Bacilli bacterium]